MEITTFFVNNIFPTFHEYKQFYIKFNYKSYNVIILEQTLILDNIQVK